MTSIIPTVSFGSDPLKLKIGRKNLICFILSDGQRIVALESIPKLLGYDGKSPNWLFEFLMSVNRLTPIEPALLESLGRPVIFTNQNSQTLRQGIPANVFTEACRAIVKAKEEGFLYMSELKFAKAAEDVLSVLNDEVIEMIDQATGFTLFKQNHKESLARKMAKATESNYPVWMKSFSDEFYEMILDFRGWKWQDLNSDSSKVGDYLIDLIFSRIDGSLLEILETTKPKMKYRKGNSREQYLEHPELSAHISAISALVKASANNNSIFEQLLAKSLPKKREMELSNQDATAIRPSFFDESLSRVIAKKR